MKLQKKVAIITGGAGYIGSAIAARLARAGASVIVADLNPEGAQAVAARLVADGATASAVELNVCARDSIKRMVQTVLQEFKAIDILVNNAGGSARKDISLFHEAREEVLDRIIDMNFKGPVFCARAVIEHMVKRRRGTIINIGSICGVQGGRNTADYSASKGGVIAFTKALAKEVGQFGITVNCVSPGLVPRPDEDPERARRSNYLGRICTGDDVASLVGFLATEEAGFITGQNYIIDGGRSLALKGD